MNLFGECIESKSTASRLEAVCFEKSGVVSQRWLSACKEERALTENLMEKISSPLNLMHACRKVMSNAGSSGIDGMTVIELQKWFQINYEYLSQELLNGTYKVSPVKTVSIKKPNGGSRNLGVPTVQDRLVQQAINQVLSPRYEKIFSKNSYGFRPNRSAHQALFQAGENVKAGKRHIIDIDIASFFDEVNQDRLMWLLSSRIGDKKLLCLIRQFLQAGTMQDGLLHQRVEGMP